MSDDMIGTEQDLWNEDWIKTLRWDIWDGATLVDDIETLRRVTKMTDAQLRRLPAINAAPAPIRRALGLPDSPER